MPPYWVWLSGVRISSLAYSAILSGGGGRGAFSPETLQHHSTALPQSPPLPAWSLLRKIPRSGLSGSCIDHSVCTQSTLLGSGIDVQQLLAGREGVTESAPDCRVKAGPSHQPLGHCAIVGKSRIAAQPLSALPIIACCLINQRKPSLLMS